MIGRFRENNGGTVIFVLVVVVAMILLKFYYGSKRHNDIVITHKGIDYIVNDYTIEDNCVMFVDKGINIKACGDYKIVE